jgi:predicted DNA-binding protein (MmcQ/YjbR family)
VTKRELIDYCLTYPSAYEDYPFDKTAAVMRHKGNNKMFALIGERSGAVYINLKCEPMRADFLRSVFVSVTPGWHMNKVHWNTVTMGAGTSCASDVPAGELYNMIQHSFDLTKPGTKQK